jgi:radical SAM superfamily enzyme YgiQ (UPF0313 family)
MCAYYVPEPGRYEGNIYRPPGEWRSYLLQCTIGCSNNQCTFCGMYKDKKFRVRPLEEILEDIDMAEFYYRSACPTRVTRAFLCDGDAIVMKQEELLTIIETLYRKFPYLERVNTYAGPRSTMTKTVDQLKELREAGLYRAYLGVETGSDELLKKVKKGVTAEEMLEAGLRLKDAGIDLWAIIMMGLAGQGEPSRKHSLETADLINRMAPQHCSAMTYMCAENTPMGEDVRAGRFRMLSQREVLEETRLFMEHIEVGPLHFTSDHASNYLPLKGTLPQEKEQLCALVDAALNGSLQTRREWNRGL